MYEEEIARLLSKHTGMPVNDVLVLLEHPDPALGDLAFPCFSLSKERKQSPQQIALLLATELDKEEPIDTIIATGPYLNFFFNKALLAQAVLTKKVSFPKRKERVMIEHSNGNTHKAVHIGHLRNLFLGDSLVRISREAGFTVVNCCFINDTGAMVAKCLWAITTSNEPQQPTLSWLGKKYAEGNKRLTEQPEQKEEVDKILQDLERGEPTITKLWKETRKISLDDWHRIFKQLRMLPFEAQFTDSELAKDVKTVIDELTKKGIAKESQGALITAFDEKELGVVIIKKSDGTTPYLTKDLVLAKKKFNDYNIDKSIYVVGSEQELHFRQLFKILELNGFPQAKNCYHLSYGLVGLKEGKLSSREGTALSFDELYEDIHDHALDEVKKRHEEWSAKKQEQTAQNITLAALRLPMIMQEPNKRITFDIRGSLDFEGETGPYLQYSFARLSSILRKHGKKVSGTIEYGVIISDEEQALIRLLARYTDVITQAAEKYKPHLVARYAVELSQAANTFYHALPILKEADAVKKARLSLVAKTKETLSQLLELMGIPVMDEM